MTPDQIALLTGVIGLIEKVWAWPAGLLVGAIIIGPWMLSLALAHAERRRFDAMREMYARNVELVKNYENISADQKDMIILNTQEWSKARNAIERNDFCPMVRLEKKIVKPGGAA